MCCHCCVLQRQLSDMGAGMYRDVVFNGPSNCADAVADAISLFEVSNNGSPIPHISAKGNVACRVVEKVIQLRDFIIAFSFLIGGVRTAGQMSSEDEHATWRALFGWGCGPHGDHRQEL